MGIFGVVQGAALHAGAVEDGNFSFVHNERPLGADVDVIDGRGRPAFRVLLPESVTATNVEMETFLSHVTPGEWGDTDGMHWGVVRNPEWVEVRVVLAPHPQGTLTLVCVKNLSAQVLENVQIDICVSVSHLPSTKDNWINPDFVNVSAPYDRDEAGLYWYERVAPAKLKALVGGEWVAAHPTPESPSSEGVPRYKPFRYLPTPASIMAVESLDAKRHLFQAWDKPCEVRYVFPGNSCMHLMPRMAESLAPGEAVFLRGEIAFTDGGWDHIARWSAANHEKDFARMKAIGAMDV